MLLMRSQWDAGLNEMTINHGPTINKKISGWTKLLSAKYLNA